jgi:hypothetical protein
MSPTDPAPPDSEDADDPPHKTASLLQVARAVLWSFFGIRRGASMSRDIGTIKPLHVIIVGVALAAVLVLLLITLVRFITR